MESSSLACLINLILINGLQDTYEEEFVDLSIPRELKWKPTVETQLYERTGANSMSAQIFVKIKELGSYNAFMLDPFMSKYIQRRYQMQNITYMAGRSTVADWTVPLGPHSLVVIGELADGKLVSTPVIVNLNQYVKGVQRMNRRYKLLWVSLFVVTIFISVGIILFALKL